VILFASELRFALGRGDPGRVVRLAGDSGFEGIAIGSECPRGDVMVLCSTALRAGLAVPVISGALPDGPLGPGRRLPHLAALDDSDERRAAVSIFSSMLELAGQLGIGMLSVQLGEVALGAKADEVATRFGRRELEEDEPGERLWAAAVGERRALSGRVLDACRYALDRILPRAERRDVALALEVAASPWSLPSPREAMDLIAEYRDGPLGVVWDDARWQALSAFGIGPGHERLVALAAAAKLRRANDAVGIETGYLPGLGDPGPGRSGEPDSAAREPVAPASGVPVVVTGRPDSTASEVNAARARVAASLDAAATAAAAKAAATEDSDRGR
jgi:sugar phosphate isomerase/epimerase